MCLQKLVPILSVSLSLISLTAGLISASGYVGKEVNISCSYPGGYESYEKYLCKNNCDSNDDILVTTKNKRKNRYTITDDQQRRNFTSTISDLAITDRGKYWCAVSKSGTDIYTEVKLEVGPDVCCDESKRLQSYEDSSVSFSCPYQQRDQNSLKYLCRGRQPSVCLQQALVTSSNKQSGRFSLTDEGSTEFSVTINDLTPKDSGSYLCGVQRHNSLDVFTAVDLQVKEWCCVNSAELSGLVGHPVTMQCPYPPQHRDNRKFLCKGENRKTCTDVMSQSRFSLQENVTSSYFMVTITELRAEDAGTYWCGSDSQWSVGNYTKIHLSVDFPTSTELNPEPTSAPDSHEKAHFLSLAVIVPCVVSLVLLILTVSVVIIYKYKSCRAQGATVAVNRNQNRAAPSQEMISVADIYENHDVVACSERGACKQLTTSNRDLTDSLYQNFSTTDDIYCNQMFGGARK